MYVPQGHRPFEPRMGKSDRKTRHLLAGPMAASLTVLTVCVGAGVSSAAPAYRASNSSETLTVAYCSNYCFDTDPLTTKYWDGVASSFEKQHSGVKVDLIAVPGSYNDIVTKLSLLYRSSSTAPDVAEMPTGQIGLWQSSGYLLPLNSYLSSASWWKSFPPVIQSEGTFGGKVYAVDEGENDSAILYNTTMFKEAGIAVPWHAKTVMDILTAAEKIKKALPKVIPIWLNAGTGSGANGLLQGINNLIVGSSTPDIFDSKTGKWVVDSPGIRESLTFYKDAYAAGLGAPVTEVFSPSAVTTPLALFADGKLAMAIGSNYYEGNWTKTISAPYWPQGAKVMAATPVPTWDGSGADIASTLGGWDYAISSHASDPKLAFQFISLLENAQNSIDGVNWAGWVPPDKNYWGLPIYTQFANYNALFAQITPHSTLTPVGPDYTVWAQGMGEATGELAQYPSTSVSKAVSILKDYVSQQIGSSLVETQH
jgi:multiple sugar transport system substrate-binding protein